jgi:pullulanase/glycogen debranching enzyme
MKQIFVDLDTENSLKLKKDAIRKYFSHLALKIGNPEFEAVNKVDDECFNDVWYEFDQNETGYLSWHTIKPMITRLLEHM